MPETKVKEKKVSKHKGLKICGIIVAVIAVIAIAAAAVISVMTKHVLDTETDSVPVVGGILVSETVDYQAESAKGLENNVLMKFMQFVWKCVGISDENAHKDQVPPDNVVKVKDIQYIDDGNAYHRLDILYPDGLGADEKLPVIVDIHGGGWMYGTKDLNEYYCLSLADRGFVVFNLSYRLVPDVTVNEQIQDIAAALKWINENMANYPCDMENVMLTGDSAGGQLAIYETALLQSAELRETFDVVDAGLNVTALMLTSPVPYMEGGGPLNLYTELLWGKDYKDKATYGYMNLDKIIDYAPNLPPTYLITSSGDTLAHNQTVMAYELLNSKGVVCEIADYGKLDGKKQPHVFSVLDPYGVAGTTAIDGGIDFYRKTIENK